MGHGCYFWVYYRLNKCLLNSISIVLSLKYIFPVAFFYLGKIRRQYFYFYLSKNFEYFAEHCILVVVNNCYRLINGSLIIYASFTNEIYEQLRSNCSHYAANLDIKAVSFFLLAL